MFQRKEKRPVVQYGRGLPGEARQAWIEANRLKEQGQYTAAAEIFERLAQAAQKRGMAERTPRLLLDAAGSRLLAGEIDRGSALLRQGLERLHARRNWKALRRTGMAALAELERLEASQAVAELRAWLEPILADLPAEIELPVEGGKETGEAKPPRPGFRLPAQCPNCGARLRSNEANWIDENHVECPDCGSAVSLRAA